MPVVEAEPHAPLARSLVTTVAAARAKVDVVVDDAVVKKSGRPIVGKPRLSSPAELIARAIGHHVNHVLGPHQQMINWQRLQNLGRNAFVLGNPVVDEVGKVERGIVFVGQTGRRAELVRDFDPISHQRAMVLARNHRRVDVVARRLVRSEPVVAHHNPRPVGGVFKRRIELSRLVQIDQISTTR